MSSRGRPKHPDILTPREWEVLGHVREGRSNEQIAERLGISIDGVKYHVSEILGKLALDNRHDAARWAESQSPRPWPAGALAPLLFWRKLSTSWVPSWLSPLIAGGLLLAVAAGLGLLIWGLLATRGDGGPVPLVLSLPTTDRLVYVGTDDNLWLLESTGPARRLTDTGAVSLLRWSPDGRYVLFRHDEAKPANAPRAGWEPRYSLWLADGVSGSVRKLAESPLSLPEEPWSADGSRVAYLRPSSDGRIASVWVSDIDGNAYELVPAGFGAADVAWSPDGTRLAVARTLPPDFPEDMNQPGARAEIPEENGIYLIDAEGGEPQPVVLVGEAQQAWDSGTDIGQGSSLEFTGISEIQWSPDNRYLAFQPTTLSASAMADGGALLTVAVDEGRPPVYHGFMLRSRALLDWFPGSHRFVFTMGGGRNLTFGKTLATAEAGVPGATVIAEEPERLPTPVDALSGTYYLSARSDAWPAVSPNGTRIAFQSSQATWTTQRLDIGKLEGPNEGIWLVDADGGDARQLTADPDSLDFLPRWSADGQFILFVRTDGQAFAGDFEGEGSPRAEIWLMRTDGSGAKLLADDLQRIGSYYGLFQWEDMVAWSRSP